MSAKPLHQKLNGISLFGSGIAYADAQTRCNIDIPFGVLLSKCQLGGQRGSVNSSEPQRDQHESPHRVRFLLGGHDVNGCAYDIPTPGTARQVGSQMICTCRVTLPRRPDKLANSHVAPQRVLLG
jgi:hypothetical protein